MKAKKTVTSTFQYLSNASSNSFETSEYICLYNNQINARALIGQSAVGYCAGKPTEKSRVFWIIVQKQ